MNLEVLKSFLAISKYKSVSKAAEALYITQPTLSARIKKLEEELNVQLLKRDWHGVELTNYGIFLLQQTIEMFSKLNDFTSIAENFKNLNNETYLNSTEVMNKTFRIGINNYLVPVYSEGIIDLLIKEYPTINFEFITGTTADLIELVDYQAVDLIVYYSNQEINQTNTKLISNDELVFVFNTVDYQLIMEHGKEIRDISGILYLNSNPALTSYLHHFREIISSLDLEKFQVVDNLILIKQLIQAGKGFAAIPASVYEEYFKSVDLNVYHLREHLPSLPCYLTYNETSEFIEISRRIYVKLSEDI